MSFTLPLIPRTKKTSNRIVAFGKPCWTCKRKPFQKVLPSEAFEEFEAAAFQVGPIIRQALEGKGVVLPIEGPVNIRALFYREALTGDATGFYQALADVLQEPLFDDGKVKRKGMGIIRDDKMIAHWDGSRLLKDSSRPRIEVTITTLDEDQKGLFQNA